MLLRELLSCPQANQARIVIIISPVWISQPMGQGVPIGEEARDIMYKVYLYFASEAEKFRHNPYFQRIQERAATATGVSKKSIYRLIKEKGKYQSGAHNQQSEVENILKRKWDNGDTNDYTNRPDIECVYIKPDPVVIKVHKIQQKPLQSNTVTSPDPTEKITADNAKPTAVNTAPKLVKIHQIRTNAEPISILPTIIDSEHKAKPPLIKIRKVAHNIVPKTVLNATQNLKSGSSLIKVHPIPKEAVPRTVLVNVPNTKKGPAFIKVYTISQDNVPKTVVESAENTAQRQTLVMKTDTIEFDPGSFDSDIKTEIEDSSLD